MADIGSLTMRIKIRGMWRLMAAALLGRLAAARGVNVKVILSDPLSENCICAAVRFEDGRVVRGHRHDACFRTADGWTPRPSYHNCEQGFITSRGRFVTRKEGARLQHLAGCRSAVTGHPIEANDTLTSEDLY